MRSPLAALAVVFLLAGCSANEAGQAFLAPDGSARTALPVTPGTTAVIGLGSLEMVKAGDSAEVLSLNVEGDHVNDPAGRVLGVKVYPLTSSGGIGAITAAELSGVDGNQGWRLQPPEGVLVPGEDPLGVVVLLQGMSLGTWSSDSLVIDYTMNGRPRTQRIPLGATVCVVVDPAQGCPT